jgi:hypothetical protein
MQVPGLAHTSRIGNLQSHKSEAILLIFDFLYKHNKAQLLTTKDKDLYKNTEAQQIFLSADFSL